MKEQFVTYPIALKLKELGFSELCFGHFINHLGWLIDCREGSLSINSTPSRDNSEYSIIAPLWQQAVSFLKIKGVLVTELWDGWEYGLDGEDFEFTETQEDAVLKAIELYNSKK